MSDNLIHGELTESIIGAAMTVLNVLKPGLDEKLYERALVIELLKRGHKVDQQRQFPVYYDGQLIGTLVPDLIVDDSVVADPKSRDRVQRDTLGPDAWLSGHYRFEIGPAPKLQKCPARLETRCAVTIYE